MSNSRGELRMAGEEDAVHLAISASIAVHLAISASIARGSHTECAVGVYYARHSTGLE